MTPTPSIRNARPAEIDRVRSIVKSCNLPAGGIEDQFEDAFIVAEQDGRIVGVAAIERYGDYGLLRSVAVIKSHRGKSVGGLLVRECLRKAQQEKLSEIYLLTTDARGYFETHGFSAVRRDLVPNEITKSREYALLCPDSATVMVLPSHNN